MAVKPKVKKRSAAQVRAGQAYAAAGRASQAATRAAAIKKTGKPPPRSKAQLAAQAKFIKAGQAALAAKRAGKAPAPTKARAAVMPDELLYPGALWPVGCNDVAPTCASVAVACHLQAATGLILSDEEILRLHELASRASGDAAISDVLEVMKSNFALFGKGRTRLLHFFRTDEDCLVAGLVVGVRLPHAGHAVVSVPGGMISWGRRMAWAGEPEEAWALEWGP